MTKSELDAIRERCDEATPGTWHRGPGLDGVESDYGLICVTLHQGGPRSRYQCEYDALFIAAARQDIPTLLAEVERLQSKVRVG